MPIRCVPTIWWRAMACVTRLSCRASCRRWRPKSMGEELVTVVAGGGRWTGFKKVTVSRKFSHAAGSFTLEIAEELGPATAGVFLPGTPIEILANGSLLLAAYVDRFQPKLGEHNQASATVSGRSKGQDFIDSSALH